MPGVGVEDIVLAGQVVLVVIPPIERHVAVWAAQVEACALTLAAMAHQVAVVSEHFGAHMARVFLLTISAHHFVAGHGVTPPCNGQPQSKVCNHQHNLSGQ